jgi:hypothetical protein
MTILIDQKKVIGESAVQILLKFITGCFVFVSQVKVKVPRNRTEGPEGGVEV